MPVVGRRVPGFLPERAPGRAMLLPVLLLAHALAVVLAQASPSPPAAAPAAQIDCKAPGGKARLSAWDRARAPNLARYCDFMAHAEARLAKEPRRAEQAAAAAAALYPEQAAPLVVRGRVAAQLGQRAEARVFFEQALALSADALRDPGAQLDLAETLREAGDTAGAIRAYRALLPRLDALADEQLRTRARLDAALALALEGPASLDVAVALARVAESRGASSLRSTSRAVLALLLDRSGARAEAAAMATQAHQTGALGALTQRGPAALGWGVEALAVLARLREVAEPQSAAASWEGYLARAGQGPWAAHARARLAESRRSPARAGRKGAP